MSRTDPDTPARENAELLRSIVNQIFAPRDVSPWEKFTAPILDELDLHVSTLLFWYPERELLALILVRKDPTNPDKYVGSFAISKPVLEWMALQESQERVRVALIASVNSLVDNEIISLAQAGEVAHRLLGKVEPWVSSKSADPFYWLDEDLFPKSLRHRGRQFRLMQEPPGFLFQRDED